MNDTLRSGDGWEVWLADSAKALREMSPGFADGIVTSPPYPDQRTYASGETDPDHGRSRPTNHSRRRRREAVEAWPEWFEPFLDGMAEALAPRGSAMVNLGVVIRDEQETDYVDETLRRAKARGWRLLHRIVWHKPNAAPPSWPRLLLVRHEYVLWLAPHGADVYRGFDDAEAAYDPDARVPYSSYSLDRLRTTFTVRNGDERYAKRGGANPIHPDGARPATVQTFPVGARRGLRHPAPMAQGLADLLVRVCCPPGGTVLDPFAGSCTTGIAALRAGRRFVGLELRPLYFEEGARRMERWHSDPAWSPPPVQADGSDHPALFEAGE